MFKMKIYRYLSFNHKTTLNIIFKIMLTGEKIKIGKLNALNTIFKKSYWNFLNFCECKELQKQNKIRLNEAYE